MLTEEKYAFRIRAIKKAMRMLADGQPHDRAGLFPGCAGEWPSKFLTRLLKTGVVRHPPQRAFGALEFVLQKMPAEAGRSEDEFTDWIEEQLPTQRVGDSADDGGDSGTPPPTSPVEEAADGEESAAAILRLLMGLYDHIEWLEKRAAETNEMVKTLVKEWNGAAKHDDA